MENEAVLYPQFDELLQSVRDEFHRRPADESVIASLFESLGKLSGSLEGGASRTQQRLAIIKRPGQPPIGTDYFRARLSDVAAELVLEREGEGEDARMRARLASGLVSLLMDTAHQCWLEAGASEPLQDVGQRCRGMMGDLLGAIRNV